MSRFLRINPVLVFAGSFLLLLILYWPARNCGWVSDTLGWLDAVRHQSFGDFINRKGFRVRSLYQTTQLVTWGLYRLFGANRLAWHLLHTGLQALNTALLFAFFRRLLSDSGIASAGRISLTAVLLFALSPSLSEVIVWEAAYHYLQGLGFILIQLLLLQAFLHRPGAWLAVLAGVLYVIASFSLELFYLTPGFSFCLLLLYRFGKPAADPGLIRRGARSFLLPQLLILAFHLLLLRLSYGNSNGRLGEELWRHPLSYYAIKPPDYLLHLLGGRYLPQVFRSGWHRFFCTIGGAGLFYAGLACSLSFMLFRFRRMSPAGQVFSWACCATLLAMVLVSPMWFPERLLVMGDRYLYLMLPFFCLMLSLALAQLRRPALAAGLSVLAVLVSGAGTWKLAAMWEHSEAITESMQRRFPLFAQGERILLLNNAANYRGIPMTGAGPDGEFALMRRLFYPHRERVYIREAFASEYTAGDVQPDVIPEGPGSFLIRLRDKDRRWWFGSDYAGSFGDAGFSAEMVSPAAYELRCSGDGNAPELLAVWDGHGYRFFRARPL